MKKVIESPVRVGNAVLIRTVTQFYTGRIVALTPKEMILSDAAWIASTGRFNAALISGVLDEIEPFRDLVSINRDTVVDVTNWAHELPKSVK